MRSTRLAPALISATLLFAACGGGSDNAASDAAAGSIAESVDADADAESSLATDSVAALQFSAPLVGGGELDASTLGDKPTVFWFWAPN